MENHQNNSNLVDLSKDYPEFKEVINNLRILAGGNKNKKKEEQSHEEIEKIERFLLSVITVAQDKHLISIIKSSEVLTEFYNQFVDAYEYYKEQLNDKEEGEECLIEKETLFLKKVEEITSKPIIMEAIQTNTIYASLYNMLVDLYNHYRRRQEIRNELKQMERSQKY